MKEKHKGEKSPLYRKVNTKARGVRHLSGGDYRHQRNTKEEKASDTSRGSMRGKERRGLDYTPLFQFLLSKVGQDWDAVFQEASARLDNPDAVFWMVALEEDDKQDSVRLGESSYFSGLFVDDTNILQMVNPAFGPEKIEPMCPCCTYTFNGRPVTKKFSGTP